MAEPNDPTTGEGYREVNGLVLQEATVQCILTGHELSRDQYAEVVSAFIRATGATMPVDRSA